MSKKLNNINERSKPVAVFNELWNMLDQRYALFSVKDIDWKNIYTQYSSTITDNMSERELFTSLGTMLKTLKDGHVALISPFDTSIYDNFYSIYSRNFNYNNIVNNYLVNDYKTIGPVIYKIADQVGYIYYGSFGQDITAEQLNILFSEMNGVKGLIFDVRNNTGGSTLNASRIVKFLTTEKRLVKHELIKKGIGHNDFFDPQAFFLTPEATTFNKPVVVLTNRACFSACNDFVLYVSELPNVTLVGDQTGGGGSIPYNYILSNGWKIQYSATVTLTKSMQPVENGILPDFNIGISSFDEAAGKDPIIEKAFSLLQ